MVASGHLIHRINMTQRFIDRKVTLIFCVNGNKWIYRVKKNESIEYVNDHLKEVLSKF